MAITSTRTRRQPLALAKCRAMARSVRRLRHVTLSSGRADALRSLWPANRRRVFTSTTTRVVPSGARATMSASPMGSRTLRARIRHPIDRRCPAAIASPRRPSARVRRTRSLIRGGPTHGSSRFRSVPMAEAMTTLGDRSEPNGPFDGPATRRRCRGGQAGEGTAPGGVSPVPSMRATTSAASRRRASAFISSATVGRVSFSPFMSLSTSSPERVS